MRKSQLFMPMGSCLAGVTSPSFYRKDATLWIIYVERLFFLGSESKQTLFLVFMMWSKRSKLPNVTNPCIVYKWVVNVL